MAILPIFVPQAACPHQCVFCNQRTISGEKETGLADVLRQIHTWLPRLHRSVANEAAFYGGSFTGLPLKEQACYLAPVEALLKAQVIGKIRLSTRPDYIDEARLLFLRQHQVSLVELGAQSLDDTVLKRAGRGHTAAQVEQAVRLLRQGGFKTGLQFMVGLPGQNWASLRATAAKAIALHPDIARIYPLLVIKDTPLATLYQSGAYQPLTVEEAVAQSAYLYQQLTTAGIQVIRVGLQPDTELCRPGNILAGPFHPSMGELVQSYLRRQQVAALLQQQKYVPGDQVLLRVPQRLESQMRGQHNQNFKFWQEMVLPATLSLEHF